MRKDTHRVRAVPKGGTDLSDLANAHLGKKCFVVGAGPSVAFAKLKCLDPYVVISVNSSILLLDWSRGSSDNRFWISNDSLCLKWDYFWKKVIKSSCTKIVRDSWRKYHAKTDPYGFRYFQPRQSESIPLAVDDGGLCSVSSVPTAIDLALLMGCQSIYLLGSDQQMMHGNSHFWQFWEKDKRPRRSDKDRNFKPEQNHQIEIFEKNISVFSALNEFAIRLGCSIYNCCNRSKLTMFPKVDLEDCL